MLILGQSILAQLKKDQLGLEDVEFLGNNNIGDKGCAHLSKVHWPNLETILLCKEFIKYLGNNNINDEGCQHISKAYWPNLGEINLCKYITIQKRTISVMSGISANPDGQI